MSVLNNVPCVKLTIWKMKCEMKNLTDLSSAIDIKKFPFIASVLHLIRSCKNSWHIHFAEHILHYIYVRNSYSALKWSLWYAALHRRVWHLSMDLGILGGGFNQISPRPPSRKYLSNLNFCFLSLRPRTENNFRNCFRVRRIDRSMYC